MTRWHRNSPLAARKGWVAPEDAKLLQKVWRTRLEHDWRKAIDVLARQIGMINWGDSRDWLPKTASIALRPESRRVTIMVLACPNKLPKN